MNKLLLLNRLEKTAATAALKHIRRLVSAGKAGEAEALHARLVARGGIKLTPQGSQVKLLGRGVETPAHLIIGQTAQKTISPSKLVVRKTVDQRAPLYSKDSFADAFNMGRRLAAKPAPRNPGPRNPFRRFLPKARGGHPQSIGSNAYAKLLSKKVHKTPSGGKFYFQEYVPGQTIRQRQLANQVSWDNPSTSFLDRAKVLKSAFPSRRQRGALREISERTTRVGKKSQLGDLITSLPKKTTANPLYTWAGVKGNTTNAVIDSKTGLPKAIDYLVLPKRPTWSARQEKLEDLAWKRRRWRWHSDAGPEPTRAGNEQLAKMIAAENWAGKLRGVAMPPSWQKPSLSKILRTLGPGSPRAAPSRAKAYSRRTVSNSVAKARAKFRRQQQHIQRLQGRAAEANREATLYQTPAGPATMRDRARNATTVDHPIKGRRITVPDSRAKTRAAAKQLAGPTLIKPTGA